MAVGKRPLSATRPAQASAMIESPPKAPGGGAAAAPAETPPKLLFFAKRPRMAAARAQEQKGATKENVAPKQEEAPKKVAQQAAPEQANGCGKKANGGGKRLQKQVNENKKKDEEKKRASELLEANAGRFDATREEAEEPSDAAEEVEDAAWNRQERAKLAESLWAAASEGSPEDPCSPRFDPAAAALRRPGRASFGTLAAVLDGLASSPGLAIRAIANVVRQLLAGPGGDASRPQTAQEDLSALMDILLARPAKERRYHYDLVGGITKAFALKSAPGFAMLAEELADTALAARMKQRSLFQAKRLALVDVGAVLRDHAEASASSDYARRTQEKRLADRLQRLLGSSVAEGRETWHLVHVLQGHTGISWDKVLRALAHGLALSLPSATSLGGAGHLQAEAIVAMEDAVLRAYSQDGGRTSRLCAAALQLLEQGGGRTPQAFAEALVSVCAPAFGVQVLPMRAESSKDVALALERLGSGDLLAEWLIQGERAQVHVEAGKVVNVFTKDKGPRGDRVADAEAALGGHLKAERAVLEVLFSRGSKKAAAEGAPESSRDLLVFDVLVLDDLVLTDRTLRERRTALAQVVEQHAHLKLVPGFEIAAEDLGAAAISARLDEALGAHALASAEDKASSRAAGLVLKRLDGSGSRYCAGSVQGWQALEKPPVAGAEAERLLFAALSEQERACIPGIDEFHFTVISGFRTRSVEGITDILKIQKLYADAGVNPTWYVDDQCPDEYRKLGLEVVKAGKLIPARNHALRDAFDSGKVCVQTSDDIGVWQFLNDPEKYRSDEEANSACARCEKLNVSPVAAARYLVAKMRARGPQCRLGGVYPLGNGGRAMRAAPESTQNFILGDFFCSEFTECRFDERMSLKEDYDFTASHLERHGEAMRSNRLIITAKHETNAGGACQERDAAGTKEQENIQILKEKWPGAIGDHPTRANQVVLRWGSLKRDKAPP